MSGMGGARALLKEFWWAGSRRRGGRFGVVILGASMVLTALGRPRVQEGGLIDLLTGFLAWTFFVGGAGLRLWATLYIGGRKGKALLTDGPYAALRNPLYAGSFLIAVAFALFNNSLVAFTGALLAAAAFTAYVIPVEERRLIERFGHEYGAYREHTPRFFPRLRAVNNG